MFTSILKINSLNNQIRHSDPLLALCVQNSNILVNINEILKKTSLEYVKYMNIYNSVLQKKLRLPPGDPKMHCEPREKLEMSTYPLKFTNLSIKGFDLACGCLTGKRYAKAKRVSCTLPVPQNVLIKNVLCSLVS